MPFSLRLDGKTEARIRELAYATGRTRSAVVREAMESYAAGAAIEHAYVEDMLARLKPFIGVVSTSRQGSTDTHAKYRTALERKHRGRRSD